MLFILVIFVIASGVAAYFSLDKNNKPSPQTQSSISSSTITSIMPTTTPENNLKIISQPISNALSRITKKPFGIYITPKNSPVSPEKFIGFHTGVDFETTADEQNADVPIYAICDGPLALKKYATGYGGVAVQKCQINNEGVTVIYGHLRLSSITVEINQSIKSGQKFAVLGKGYSTETDGERKHLHLGIHKGKSISLLGYVQDSAQLSNWIDAQALLK